MAIITLTSDWGTSDYYLAAVKGAILSQLPDAVIVDISHHIKPFDIESAAFTVRNCFRSFPPGTIHILAMNTEESVEHPHIVVRSGNHYLIGADNGIFNMVLGDDVDEVYELDIIQDSGYFTFSTRDRFVKAAVGIARGLPLSDLGDQREGITKRMLLSPAYTNDNITGIVVHVDAYENAITNISQTLFNQVGQKRRFEIRTSGYILNKIHLGYTDVGIAKLVALFGTHGMLEIAVNHGNAASLCGLWRDTQVRIEFFNDHR
ncbi:MAG: SAM-dependent chlorinase/fluorinase [Bacteroidales bacterium]|nr:SAM-dependent chlorinase/fluorinase [Bacteroidales bacterium]